MIIFSYSSINFCYFYEYDFPFRLLQPFNLTTGEVAAYSISTSTLLLELPLLINGNGLLLYMGSNEGIPQGISEFQTE